MITVCIIVLPALLAADSVSATPAIQATGNTSSGWTLGVAGHPPAFAAWTPTPVAGALQLVSTVDATPVGMDVMWTVKNDTTEPIPLRALPLPSLSLGPEIACMDFRSSGWPQALTEAGPYQRMQGTWPGSMYSPVAVAMNTKIAVGISVQYPVLEYQHDCALVVEAAGDGVWDVKLLFSGKMKEGDFPLRHSATLPAGASRTYIVSIRATANPLQWIDTLLPYRDWFRSTFGSVTYAADTSAIRGCILAFSHNQSDENPGGWVAAANRPDLNGYQSVINILTSAMQNASRAILWAPSGMTYQHKKLNYPFQFTTHWLANGGPMGNAPSLLSRVQTRPGLKWGLWWGHSVLYTPAFDTLPSSPLDIHSPEQRQSAFAELRLAMQSGATLIGLDAFSTTYLPAWDLVGWIGELQEEAPDVTFCTEGLAPDFLHRLAPTWLDMYSATPKRFGSNLRIRGRFLLADFLLPGHETWAAMLFDRSPDQVVREGKNQGARHVLIEHASQYGYAPVVFSDINLRSIGAD